uniref:Uncharacterized protein n=1 Tax=Tanacetum cinerariifolium TaxID=118510 RepID=A0A699S280_TANCI|nr:hypothetical protein [Tanacetum cinerariifolium]
MVLEAEKRKIKEIRAGLRELVAKQKPLLKKLKDGCAEHIRDSGLVTQHLNQGHSLICEAKEYAILAKLYTKRIKELICKMASSDYKEKAFAKHTILDEEVKGLNNELHQLKKIYG